MNSLKPLLYFSIFNYPLSAKEIYLYSEAESEQVIDEELKYLKDKGVVLHDDQYYAIRDLKKSVTRRKAGNKMADEVMDKAIKRGVFISKFPYVEAVGISGSLSKNYHDLESDVDFFIITAPNRLWVTRTLLMLYKKVFLFNSKKLFCINYYITKANLEITEQNIFTATELVTLIPVTGDFEEFYNKNQWATKFFPNQKIGKTSKVSEVKKPIITKIIQAICNSPFGTLIDKIFLKLTLKKWGAKFAHLSKKDFAIALKSSKGVSKHHPRNFQKRVIETLNEKYAELQSNHNITIEKEHA